MLYHCMFCVALSMDLFVSCLTVFVNCLVKQFAMCFCVLVILLLNVMVLFTVVGGALLDRGVCVVPGITVYVLMRSFHLLCLCFVCRKLTPHLRV